MLSVSYISLNIPCSFQSPNKHIIIIIATKRASVVAKYSNILVPGNLADMNVKDMC